MFSICQAFSHSLFLFVILFKRSTFINHHLVLQKRKLRLTESYTDSYMVSTLALHSHQAPCTTLSFPEFKDLAQTPLPTLTFKQGFEQGWGTAALSSSHRTTQVCPTLVSPKTNSALFLPTQHPTACSRESPFQDLNLQGQSLGNLRRTPHGIGRLTF